MRGKEKRLDYWTLEEHELHTWDFRQLLPLPQWMEPSQVGRKAGEATVKYILRLCVWGREKLGNMFSLLEGLLHKRVSAAFLISIGSSLSWSGTVLNTSPPPCCMEEQVYNVCLWLSIVMLIFLCFSPSDPISFIKNDRITVPFVVVRGKCQQNQPPPPFTFASGHHSRIIHYYLMADAIWSMSSFPKISRTWLQLAWLWFLREHGKERLWCWSYFELNEWGPEWYWNESGLFQVIGKA